MRVSAFSMVPWEVNLVGHAGALDVAAQPALKRVVATQTCLSALAKVEAQCWFLFADAVLSPSAKAIIYKVTL